MLDAKKEALRQTERRAEAQLAFAIASDQRAIQFCAALGIVITILAQGDVGTGSAAVLRIVALATLLCAAGMAAYSCRPVRLYSASGESNGFSNYYFPELSEKFLDALITRNDSAIAKNDVQIRKNGRVFTNAMIVAAFGIGLLILRLLVTTNQQGA
ncbi:hypothetical protein [Paracoccus sp. S1E-3]|uniref:hypothetical protein n=1 Tax=Paracoccus sp. S1E-3 TaxID=2756130 RepID=UPI0015EF1817|nr:hypothetical protein [Paracoccus sp. S1E-3]MBA4489268.1 hypothetical protein [Paracoccus sp. S1E-3]